MVSQALEFFLFRVTVHPSRHAPLLGTGLSHRDKALLLGSALAEQPSAQWGRTTWHVGNVQPLDDSATYFRLGRERVMSVPQTDARGNFVDREAPVSPYTHAVLDARLGVCAVARRSSVSAKPETLGSQLSRVLSASETSTSKYVEIQAASIKEPDEFLARLSAAFAIHRLWVVNRRPNPFDVDKDFVRPTTRALEELGADTVRTEWSGDQLKVDDTCAVSIIRSTAATGGDAGAVIREESTAPSTRVSLSENRARIQEEFDGEDFLPAAVRLANKVRSFYQRIWPGE